MKSKPIIRVKGIVKDLILRYILIAVLAPSLPLFYLILLPLTLYPVYFLLRIFYEINLNINTLLINSYQIDIIPACVGASAIFLLALLNLATPSIKLKKRINVFLATAGMFLIFNWLRIFILAALFVSGVVLFDQIHIFTWYFISTIAVAAIWLISTKIFSIKKAPFLSDFSFLKRLSKN